MQINFFAQSLMFFSYFFFFFNDTATTEIYTLSLHDALPILIPGPAAAQVGATTDIITGKVTGPDSQPLPGAVVVATSVETRVSHQRTSDANGRFTIVFPDGGGRYELTARFVGMAAVPVHVARPADQDRVAGNNRPGLAAVPP